MTRTLRSLYTAILVGGLAATTGLPAFDGFAQQAQKPRLEGQALVSALREGGLVLLMRHMSTDDYVPGEGSHDGQDCGTQRNLDARGREEATALGQAIAKLGVPIGPVLSSPYCRCVETGTLAFGEVLPVPELAVMDQLTVPEKDVRGKQIRDMLNTAPPAGKNTVLVTHTGTLLYTFGLKTRPEGVTHVFRPAEFGNAIYLGTMEPDDWGRFSGAAATPTP